MTIPELGTISWLLGALCGFFVGAAKTGVPGLGILVVPMMVFAAGDARQSAGWLLPMLCTADVFAIFYYRRHAAAGRLFSLIPWVLAGIAMGAAALGLSERILRPGIGVIVLAMLALYLRRRLRPDTFTISERGWPYGIAAGFATTVANAAGPVMSIYLLSKRLPKEEFVATGAWFFFIVNLTKVPIYLWHGLITPRSLAFDALMLPAIFAGALAGRWMIHRIPERTFEMLVIAMTAVSAVILFR